MTNLMADIIELLVGGIVGIGEGIGTGLSSLASSIFLTGTEGAETLSVFGSIVLIFAGVSLGFTLTRWVLNFITSLGSRNR